MFSMQTFLPYRLAVLAEDVSHAVGALYQQRFAISRNEWRILAALAELETATATELGAFSTLDKMQVSRALAEMEENGFVARGEGRADRRTKQVTLTAKGRRLYDTIVPLVKEREEALLSALTDEQRRALSEAMDLLTAAARGARQA